MLTNLSGPFVANAGHSTAPADGLKVLFVHVPRTAGTTFRREVLCRVYGDHDRLKVKSWGPFAPALLTAPEPLLYGHMNAPRPDQIPAGVRTVLLSIVREPVQRAWSVYSRKCLSRLDRFDEMDREAIDRAPDLRNLLPGEPRTKHVLAKFILSRPSFEEFVLSYLPAADNEQCKILAGCRYPGAVLPETAPALFEAARANIEAQSHLIGATDSFDEFVEACCRGFGWKASVERSHLQSPSRTRPMSAETTKLVQAQNLADSALYEYCKAGD